MNEEAPRNPANISRIGRSAAKHYETIQPARWHRGLTRNRSVLEQHIVCYGSIIGFLHFV